MEAPGALTNATSYLPSPADLLLALPRLLSKAYSLGDVVLRSGGSAIAVPTLVNGTNTTAAMTASAFVQDSVAAAASTAAATALATASGAREESSMFQALKTLAGFASFITSKWVLASFAMVSRLTCAGSTLMHACSRPHRPSH